MTATATPAPGTVRNTAGRPCPSAHPEDYPLYASCAACGRSIRCADGSADWCHTTDHRPACCSRHLYRPTPGSHRWRTCWECGQGANATIHRTEELDQ